MHTLAYYIHNLNPVIFHLGWIKPRWYGFAYLMGFLGAYLLIRKQSRDGMLRLHPDRVADLVLNCCIFGVLIGGRLGFVLFYDLPISLDRGETPLLWNFTGAFPFWGVFRVWDGGMSAHGGVLFTILTLMIFAWKQYTPGLKNSRIAMLILGTVIGGLMGWTVGYAVSKNESVEVFGSIAGAIGWMTYYGWRNAIPVVNLGDAACMVVPVGLCFGRIANFVNGELYGHPSMVPWAVQFPSEVYAPTNGEILPAVQEKLPDVMRQVLGPGEWVSRQGFDEGLRLLSDKLLQHQADAVSAVAAIIPPRHPSQLYEALLEGVVLFIICWTIGRLWRKDGMASGAFLTLYPVMRIIGEQFRVGDTPVHVFGIEISKGILYSLPMVIGGAIYWGYWIRRDRRIVWVPQKATPPIPPASSVPPLATGRDPNAPA